MADSQDTSLLFSQYAQNPYEDTDDFFEAHNMLRSRSAEPTKKSKQKRDSTRKRNEVSSASYVINKDGGKGKKLIKIKVIDLENAPVGIMTTPGCDSDNVVLTAAQYVVKDSVDEIMNLTELILSKISRKLVGDIFN